MWRLIRAEFSYDKFRILLVLLFCITCFVTIWYGVKLEQNRPPMIMLIMLVGTIAASFLGEKIRILNKRDRLYLCLPVRIQEIGISHLLYSFFIWLGILIVFYAGALIVQPLSNTTLTAPSIIQSLTLNGLILFANAAYLLNRDLRAVFYKQPLKTIIFFFWLVSYVAIFLPFYIVINFAGAFGENTQLQLFLLKLSVSPLWINGLGLLFSAISLIIFLKRRSYVEF